MITNMLPPGRVHYMEVGGAMVRSIAVLIPKSTKDGILSGELPKFIVTDQI